MITRLKSKPPRLKKVGCRGKGRRYRVQKNIVRPAHIPQTKSISTLAIQRFQKRSKAYALPVDIVYEPSPTFTWKKKRKLRIERRAYWKSMQNLWRMRKQMRIPNSVPDHLVDWYLQARERDEEISTQILAVVVA